MYTRRSHQKTTSAESTSGRSLRGTPGVHIITWPGSGLNRQLRIAWSNCVAYRFMLSNSCLWPSTTRVRSSSLTSIVHTSRSEVPPRMMPSRRGIM